FQRFLAADGALARGGVARQTGVSAAEVDREAGAAIPLEMYFPVPEHRRAWTGDANLLVATAIGDHDIPVAFDLRGHRILLDPARPPATPVIVLVPVETDFTPPPALRLCDEDCGGGGSPPAPPTRARPRGCSWWRTTTRRARSRPTRIASPICSRQWTVPTRHSRPGTTRAARPASTGSSPRRCRSSGARWRH